MVDKRTTWSMIGCLLWTFCFVVLAFVPEIVKMPVDASKSRDLLHDFMDMWISAWLCACFCSAILVDAFIEKVVKNETVTPESSWSLHDLNILFMIILLIVTIAIFGTKMYFTSSTNSLNSLVGLQLILGTAIKFMSFKNSYVESHST